MADNSITSMELKLEGELWNTVKLRESKRGRYVEHEWYNVPKKIVMKLLNNSSEPSVSDFESWMRDYDTENNKKKELVTVTSSNWWCK